MLKITSTIARKKVSFHLFNFFLFALKLGRNAQRDLKKSVCSFPLFAFTEPDRKQFNESLAIIE